MIKKYILSYKNIILKLLFLELIILQGFEKEIKKRLDTWRKKKGSSNSKL